jgi:hypothetical protein
MTVDALARARLGVFANLGEQRRAAWIEAVGPSMRPLIEHGDELLVDFGARPTARGEIVVVADGERIVAHRLVTWDDRDGTRRIRAKGDAERFADDPLPESAVLGIVRAIRAGFSGRESRRGLAGRLAAAIAATSWATDRLLRANRRVTRRLPGPLGVPSLDAISWIASIPLRVVLVLARPTRTRA